MANVSKAGFWMNPNSPRGITPLNKGSKTALVSTRLRWFNRQRELRNQTRKSK
jgi:hypothetical protein